MKQIILIFCILGMGEIVFAQTNTFPSSGNVGIGTTTPSSKLDIQVNDDSNNLVTHVLRLEHGTTGTPGNGVGVGILFRLAGSAGTISSAARIQAIYTNSSSRHSDLLFWTRGTNGETEQMRITSAGNVGIGTTTPSSKLDIQANDDSNNSVTHVLRLEHGTTGTPGSGVGVGILFRLAGSAGTISSAARIQAIYTNSSSRHSDLLFWTRGTNGETEQMRITSAGNVGIGTTSPAEKLSVNGKIRAKEIKIETTSWPDFVFEPDYKLPDLKETEQFINENKHLPEIPSAKEVAENGINLGEMNAKLLQKVEELTLHLIEQNKALQEMQQEIRDLKSK